MAEPTIIPPVPAQEGDIMEHDGERLLVGKHCGQGKDLVGATHIMFNAKGAFGLMEEQAIIAGVSVKETPFINSEVRVTD